MIRQARLAGRRNAVALLGWGALAIALFALGRAVTEGPLAAYAAVGAGLLLVAAIDRRVNPLVGAVTVLLILGSSTLVAGESRLIFIAKFAALGALACSAVPLLAARSQPFRSLSAFPVAFHALAAAALVSAAWSVEPVLTLERGAGLLLLAAVSLAVGSSWADGRSVVRTMGIMFWLAALATVAGFAGRALGVDPFLAGRFTGILVNPNTLGYFVASVFPFGWLLARGARSGRERLMVHAGMAVIGVGLILSGSRAGLLSAGAGALFGLLLVRDRWRSLLGLGVLTVALAASLIVTDRPVRPGILQDGSGSGRVEVWGEAVRLIAERPVGGWGFGTADVVFPLLRSGDIARSAAFQGGHVSNSYLEIALELGTPLALGFVLLIAWSAAAAFRASRLPGMDGLVGAALFGAVVGGVVEASFESGMTAAGGLFALPFWTAVAGSHFLLARERSRRWGSAP